MDLNTLKVLEESTDLLEDDTDSQDTDKESKHVAKRVAIGICLCCLCFCILPFVIFFSVTESLCGISEYNPHLVLPSAAHAAGVDPIPITVATEDNMKTKGNPIDFTGIWWIRWVDPPLFSGTWWYNKLRIEELVSMAEMESNVTGEPWFPQTISAPTGKQHRWGFTSSLVSRVGMNVKASSSPFGKLTAVFWNSTAGSFSAPSFPGVGKLVWLANKIDDDQWKRTTVFESGLQIPYMLTRIIYANGTAHPEYWPAFLKHMRWFGFGPSYGLRVYSTDSSCIRKCAASTVANPWNPCGSCEKQCASEL